MSSKTRKSSRSPTRYNHLLACFQLRHKSVSRESLPMARRHRCFGNMIPSFQLGLSRWTCSLKSRFNPLSTSAITSMWLLHSDPIEVGSVMKSTQKGLQISLGFFQAGGNVMHAAWSHRNAISPGAGRGDPISQPPHSLHVRLSSRALGRELSELNPGSDSDAMATHSLSGDLSP